MHRSRTAFPPALAFTLVTLLAASSPAQVFGGTFTPIPIPDGPGACGTLGSPAVTQIVVPPGTPTIFYLAIELRISHTWYGDVDLVVSSPGTGPVLVLSTSGTNCGSSSDLNGNTSYFLADNAPRTLDGAAALTPSNAAIPGGPYQADFPLSFFNGTSPVGTWTFTFRDRGQGDTGFVSGVRIYINQCPFTAYLLGQTAPGQPLVITHFCAIPGDYYIAPAVLGPNGTNPGAVPTGWFLGLDISVPALYAELSFGVPFLGVIPPSGTVNISIPGIPPGTVISTCAAHVNPVSGASSFVATAFNYIMI